MADLRPSLTLISGHSEPPFFSIFFSHFVVKGLPLSAAYARKDIVYVIEAE